MGVSLQLAAKAPCHDQPATAARSAFTPALPGGHECSALYSAAAATAPCRLPPLQCGLSPLPLASAAAATAARRRAPRRRRQRCQALD